MASSSDAKVFDLLAACVNRVGGLCTDVGGSRLSAFVSVFDFAFHRIVGLRGRAADRADRVAGGVA
jgi:hypothetical protein